MIGLPRGKNGEDEESDSEMNDADDHIDFVSDDGFVPLSMHCAPVWRSKKVSVRPNSLGWHADFYQLARGEPFTMECEHS